MRNPRIKPDESGTHPRCSCECPSYRLMHDSRYLDSVRCEITCREPTNVCLPRLLEVYVEHRQLLAKQAAP